MLFGFGAGVGERSMIGVAAGTGRIFVGFVVVVRKSLVGCLVMLLLRRRKFWPGRMLLGLKGEC